jgi:hypothetical protein
LERSVVVRSTAREYNSLFVDGSVGMHLLLDLCGECAAMYLWGMTVYNRLVYGAVSLAVHPCPCSRRFSRLMMPLSPSIDDDKSLIQMAHFSFPSEQKKKKTSTAELEGICIQCSALVPLPTKPEAAVICDTLTRVSMPLELIGIVVGYVSYRKPISAAAHFSCATAPP